MTYSVACTAIFVLSLSLFAQNLQVNNQFYGRPIRPFALGPNVKSWEVDLLTSTFITSHNVDIEGNSVQLKPDSAYSMQDGQLVIRYGLTEKISFGLGGRIRRNQSTTNGKTLTAQGFESYLLEAKYALQVNRYLLTALKLVSRGTLYKNQNYELSANIPSDELILGDAGMELNASLGISYYKTPSFIFDAEIAAVQPGNNLGPEIAYLSRTSFAIKSLAVYVGVNGVVSLKGDEFTNYPLDKPLQASGQTDLFNSINRSWLSPHAGISTAFKNWTLGVELAKRNSGRSTDLGQQISINLQWRSMGVSRNKRKVKKFKEYNLSATVVKVSKRRRFVQIDKGLNSGIVKGTIIDIF